MADDTRQALLDIQTRLNSQLTTLSFRDSTLRSIWVVPDIDFIPPHAAPPFVTIKDGDIEFTDMANTVRDRLMRFHITAYVRHEALETSVLGNTGQSVDGVLTLAESIKTALNDFALPNFTGCIDYFRVVEEGGSEMAIEAINEDGDISGFLQSKELTFELLIQETI